MEADLCNSSTHVNLLFEATLFPALGNLAKNTNKTETHPKLDTSSQKETHRNSPDLPLVPLPLRDSVMGCGQFPSLRVMYCSSAQLQKEKGQGLTLVASFWAKPQRKVLIGLDGLQYSDQQA